MLSLYNAGAISLLTFLSSGALNKVDKHLTQDSLKQNRISLMARTVLHALGSSHIGQFSGKCIDVISDKTGLTGAIFNYRKRLAATLPISHQTLRNTFAYHLVKSGLKKEHTVYDDKGAKYLTIFREKTKGGSTGVGVKLHQKQPSNRAD